jgi:hypothetical protein
VREVRQSEWVVAAVGKATERIPSFRRVFEEGVQWQLRRAPLDESVPIPGTSPQLYAIDSTAWMAEGIPRMVLAFRYTDTGIEIVRLTLHFDARSGPNRS